jgi:hypothetical protein
MGEACALDDRAQREELLNGYMEHAGRSETMLAIELPRDWLLTSNGHHASCKLMGQKLISTRSGRLG